MANYDVFISYSRKDMAVANRLCDALDKLGVSYWIDRNIHGSANFLSEITRYIRNCRVVVFIASPNSAQSEWTQKEILFALKHKKEIIPYRIGNFHFEDNDELDFVFTNVQWIESEAAVVSALKELGCTFGSTPAPIPAPKPVPTPKSPRNPINWRKWIKSSAIGTFAVALVALFAYALFAPDTNIVSSYSVDSVSIMEARLAKAEAEREAHEEAARLAKAEAERKAREEAARLSKAEAERKAHEEAARKTYRVGDYYNENGKQGVVFEVTADGKHGKIVSMTQSRGRLQWSSDKAEQERFIGADSKTNGAYNMAKVKAVADWQSKYPAFKWCADLGEGWYLPAIVELQKFALDDAVLDAVNRTLASKGGVKLFNRGDSYKWYWSSSERDYQFSTGEFCAWYVRMNYGSTNFKTKFYDNYVRAVSAF